MKPIKSILIILLSLTSVEVFSQYTDVINSNRPGVSRSAFSVGTDVVQFEVGPYMIKEKRTPATPYKVDGFGVDFAARYGFITDALELSVESAYQSDTKTFNSTTISNDERANFKYFTVGAKYLIFYPNKEDDKPNLHSWKANHSFKWKFLIPAVSVYVGANYDTKNNPYTAPTVEGFSPKVMIATQNNFYGAWVFVMNFIKDRIGTDQADFQYILSLTHALNPKWVVFAETQGIQSDFYADNLFRVGGGYLWNQDFQLDTAVTLNSKNTPAIFGVNFGMSYRLDFHKDKLIDNGTSAKDEGKRRLNKSNKTTGVIEDFNKKNKRKNKE